MGPLEQYYEEYDEDGRLLLRHGQVEYLTTMRCIKECIALLASPDGTRPDGHMGPSVLEVGAGTGRYSVTLAKEGFHVTAVELVSHNLDLLRAKLAGRGRLSCHTLCLGGIRTMIHACRGHVSWECVVSHMQ